MDCTSIKNASSLEAPRQVPSPQGANEQLQALCTLIVDMEANRCRLEKKCHDLEAYSKVILCKLRRNQVTYDAKMRDVSKEHEEAANRETQNHQAEMQHLQDKLESVLTKTLESVERDRIDRSTSPAMRFNPSPQSSSPLTLSVGVQCYGVASTASSRHAQTEDVGEAHDRSFGWVSSPTISSKHCSLDDDSPPARHRNQAMSVTSAVSFTTEPRLANRNASLQRNDFPLPSQARSSVSASSMFSALMADVKQENDALKQELHTVRNQMQLRIGQLEQEKQRLDDQVRTYNRRPERRNELTVSTTPPHVLQQKIPHRHVATETTTLISQRDSEAQCCFIVDEDSSIGKPHLYVSSQDSAEKKSITGRSDHLEELVAERTAAVEGERDALQREVIALRRQLDDARCDLLTLEKRLALTPESFSSGGPQGRSFSPDDDSLVAARASLNHCLLELEEASRANVALKSDLETLRNQHRDLSLGLARSNQQNTAITADRDRILSLNESLRHSVETLELDCHQKLKTILTLQSTLKDRSNELRVLRETCNNAERSLAVLHADRNAKEEALRGQVLSLSGKLRAASEARDVQEYRSERNVVSAAAYDDIRMQLEEYQQQERAMFEVLCRLLDTQMFQSSATVGSVETTSDNPSTPIRRQGATAMDLLVAFSHRAAGR